MPPILSIIVPLHNKGPYVAQMVESVLAQSFVDWEMIVVENHSTDDGPAVVCGFASRDNRLQLVIAPPEVRGPGAARNIGLKEARGTWIQFLDADDLLLPGHFESQLQAIKANPDADIITCDWIEGAEQGSETCERKRPTNWLDSETWRSSAIAFTPWVVHAAWVKRSALGQEKWWNTSFDGLIAEDFPFWFKLLLQANVSYSAHPGVFYRIDTNQRRNSETDVRRYLDSLDKGVSANIEALVEHRESLNYRHRKALFNLYLGLTRFSNTDEQFNFRLRTSSRLREMRPGFLEAVCRRDLAVALSYILPCSLQRTLVSRRRKLARQS